MSAPGGSLAGCPDFAPTVIMPDSCRLLLGFLALMVPVRCLAQVEPNLDASPRIPLAVLAAPESSPSSSLSSPHRMPLFRIMPGFPTELRWLDGDAPPPQEVNPLAPLPEDDLDWIALSAGNDNPYFDFRKPGDPGGVGFARLHTQVALWESERTAFTLGFQAVTPLGIESDGLADRDGATVVSPMLSIFHALDDQLAVQAFVGKNLPLTNRGTLPVRRPLQYGLALQQALAVDASDPLRSFYVSMGALGQLESEDGRARGLSWELLPALQWRPGDSWWLSAGYLVPVGSLPSVPLGQWQLTCSWQY